MSIAKALTSSNRQDWCTPHDVLMVVEAFAPIVLDPCSNPSSVVRAQRCYRGPAAREDGLALPWASTTYCNPPYGDALPAWSHKISDEWRARGVESISLVPARTDTFWWRTATRRAAAICFWNGRIQFIGAPDPAPFPSAFIYHGARVERFAAIFAAKGWIARSLESVA